MADLPPAERADDYRHAPARGLVERVMPPLERLGEDLWSIPVPSRTARPDYRGAVDVAIAREAEFLQVLGASADEARP